MTTSIGGKTFSFTKSSQIEGNCSCQVLIVEHSLHGFRSKFDDHLQPPAVRKMQKVCEVSSAANDLVRFSNGYSGRRPRVQLGISFRFSSRKV